MTENGDNSSGSKPESLIRNADHFEIMRVVAGRIAAEIAQHLTPLTAYPQVIRQGMDSENENLPFVYKIESSAKEIDFIVHQLLLLSDNPNHEEQMLNINEIVDKIVVQAKKQPNVFARSIEGEFDPDLSEVYGAHDEIMGAIENLCMNAIESLTQGGKLLIRTRNVTLEDYTSDCGLQVKAGDYVRVSVEDSGSGIPENIKARIFEPFVTSKNASGKRHAGLGLTVAFKIMMNCGGGIDYKSTPGEGSIFALIFPATRTVQAETAEIGKAESEVALPVPRNNDRVMVVDNDKMILRLFNMILSEALAGVKLDFVKDGEQAVEKFELKHHAIIVMDIHMPVMDGYAAFNRIQEICYEKSWELPSVVFCTGFPVSDEMKAFIAENPSHSLLSKPVNGQMLVEAVKSHMV